MPFRPIHLVLASAFRRAALLIAVVCTIAAAPARAQLNTDLPPAGQGIETENRIGQKIPLDLPFTDSSGKKTTLAAYFGRPSGSGEATQASTGQKPVLMMLMYYRCPLLCPKTLQELVTTVGGLDGISVGKDFDIVVVSFDPRDTPLEAQKRQTDTLLSYDRNTTDLVRSSWSFLTGPVESSKPLADALGFHYKFLTDVGEFSHQAVLFVLTPDGTISRYLPGLQSTMEFRSRDVRLALVEASQGRLGSWVDWFMARCYHFDAASGSYVLIAMRVMQIGAGLTAVILGSLIGALFAFEKRRRRRTAAPAVIAETIGAMSSLGGSGGVPGGRLAGHAQ